MSVGVNGNFFLQQDVSGIEPGVDSHGGDAGHGFAAGDRPLDRRGPAIFWQQRSMQIDVAKRRQIDHPLRNDAPIPDDNDCVRLERGELAREIRRCS